MIEVDTIKRAGFTATIYYDEQPSSPAEWCNIGTLAYDTREASLNRDNLPSDHYGYGRFSDDCDYCSGEGFIVLGGVDSPEYQEPCSMCEGEGRRMDGLALAKRLHGATYCLPVRAWDDRNGTELRIADSWEEANGWIYTTGECSCGCGCRSDMATDEDVIAALKGELKAWQQWAQGDVYGVIVTDPNGNELDSCWGFYGMEYAEESAKEMLDIDAVNLIEKFPAMSELQVN